MTAFFQCIRFVLAHEGGYSHNPDDPGGETKYGISKRAHPDLDIGGLTEQDAMLIYQREYWTVIGGDDLPGPVAMALFDFAVHSGPAKAVESLQKVLDGDLVKDGRMGPKTAAAAQGHDPLDLAHALIVSRARYLARLFRGNLSTAFLGGVWVRLLDLEREIHRMED